MSGVAQWRFDCGTRILRVASQAGRPCHPDRRSNMLKNFFAIALVIVASSWPTAAQERDPAQQPYERAGQRYQKQDYDGAIADYTRAISLSTSRSAQANGSARFDFAPDSSDSEPITFIGPLIASAYGGRAMARFRNGDITGAIADCDQALLLNPGLAEVYNNRGVFRWKKGDLDGALADFDRFIKLRPKNAQAYDNRGSVLLSKGDAVSALKNFEQAIALNPQKAEFYCNRGQARPEIGDIDGGLADCDYAIKLNPNLPQAFYCRGRAKYLTDLNGALAAFQKAVELDPGMAEAHGSLGWVLWHLGQEAEAEKEFAECFRLDPSLQPRLEQRIREAKLKRAAK